MDGQDWTPVTIKKTFTKAEEKKKNGTIQKKSGSINAQTTASGVPAFKLEQEDYKPPTVTSAMAQQIIQGRLAKKWNQEQLAREAQLPISVIKTYERPDSTTIINQGFIQKISKAIGIQIKK
jgi:ribosome-binding protein aMBF1 (putative translation factor)